MKLKQILIGGILAGIVIEVISMGFSWLAQSIWNYDVLKLAGMRTINDPVSILFFVYPWVLGFALVCVYSYFEKALEGNYFAKGWKFGLLMWVVVSISSAFLVFASMDYPIGFTVNSIIGPLVYMPVAGIVVAKIFDWTK
jgi:hypothetical protein